MTNIITYISYLYESLDQCMVFLKYNEHKTIIILLKYIALNELCFKLV